MLRVMVFNATFNHISVISCCIEYTSPCAGFELITLMVIYTDCTAR